MFSGKSPKYSKEETQHRVIGQQANQWEGVDWKYVKYCTEEFASDMPEFYYLRNGDVLLNTLGNGTLGRSGIFYNIRKQEKVLTDGHLFVFRNICVVLSKYLLLYFRTKYDEIVKSANGSTNQTFLCLGRTLQWLLPVPPFNEIKRIIYELDKFEPLIDEYDKLEQQATKLDDEIYDKLKKSILQYAIQGKLVPQDPNDEPASVLLERIRAEKKAKLCKKYVDSYIYKGDDNCYYEKFGDSVKEISDEIPFDTPESWQWIRIDNLFQHNTGKALNSSNTQGALHPYITTSNVYWGYFNLKRVKEMPFTGDEFTKCSIVSGDLLVCEGGDVGRAAIWRKDIPMCIQNHIHRLRAYHPVCTAFYYFAFYAYKSIGLIGGKGIGIQGLSSGALGKLIFPLPSLAEQGRIVKQVKTILAKLKDEV